MASAASVNAVIAQSGGPTAVINQSLAGCLLALRGAKKLNRIYGARHAVAGMVADDFIDLTEIDDGLLERIAATPSSALGSSRHKPDAAYCKRILDALAKRDIHYFFYIGGNDSSDTCRIVHEQADRIGYDLHAFHIPKTVDNDLVLNDHCPGYGSAARYVANMFMGDDLDNRALPGVKVNVVMGRHAGFLTAASALARRRDDDGPHLIYLPERGFDVDSFIADVDRVHSKLGRCQIAVSEGIHDSEGNLMTAVLSSLKETDAHGNVQLSGTGALGDFLADLLRERLGSGKLRARADTLGYAQRSFPDPSPIDQREAREVGRRAAELALEGAGDASITITRSSDDPYTVEYSAAKLSDIAGNTRTMPDEYIGDAGSGGVTDAFIRYARPLVGELRETAHL